MKLGKYLKTGDTTKDESNLAAAKEDLKNLQQAQLNARSGKHPDDGTYLDQIQRVEGKIIYLDAWINFKKAQNVKFEHIISSLDQSNNVRFYLPGDEYKTALNPWVIPGYSCAIDTGPTTRINNSIAKKLNESFGNTGACFNKFCSTTDYKTDEVISGSLLYSCSLGKPTHIERDDGILVDTDFVGHRLAYNGVTIGTIRIHSNGSLNPETYYYTIDDICSGEYANRCELTSENGKPVLKLKW